jgi:hypothetical protein
MTFNRGDVYRRRVEFADDVYNVVEVTGEAEGELLLRPHGHHGTVISATPESLLAAFTLESAAAEPEDTPDLYDAGQAWSAI